MRGVPRTEPYPHGTENVDDALIARFEKWIEKQERGCWLWVGTNSKGYGSFTLGRKNGAPVSVRAHRFAYEVWVGVIPNGHHVHHRKEAGCVSKLCVNPAHLEALSAGEHILRHRGFASINASKTHCPKGHPYDEANTYRKPDGRRVCKACRLEAQREIDKRKKAERGKGKANRG